MDDVEKVKQKLDIVELIGELIQLKKAGRNFKGLCPFHSEKTPSFVVSPERQIWHCFGCQKGSDIFGFLMEYENITFAESLKDLALRAGIKLTTTAFRSEKERRQELIYSLNHLSSQFYNYLLLNHPAGKIALEYLVKKRKLTIPLIRTFMLGYAPSNSALATFLIKKKKYKEEDLIMAGLAFKKGRDLLDFFYNRIIFPIIDSRGNVVAFSGRALTENPPAGGPKYVNTKETPVYIKGDTLFGIDRARDGIKKEGKAIIVEGEFDVITAHKEGITNIVAVKGTALTENQIKLLKRMTLKFAFCFDSDPAGTEAQRRSIQLIEREGITATVIIPPSGKDPDELLNENPAAFKKAVKIGINVYDFIINSAINQFDKQSAEGKKEILDKTLPYLASIENEVIKEHYLKKLASNLDTSIEAINKQIEKIEKPEARPQIVAPRAQLPAEEITEIYLLSLIFQSSKPKESLAVVRKSLSGVPFSTQALEKVLSHLEKYEQKESVFSPGEFAKILPPELHVPFDTAFLAPIPEFADENHLLHEIEKTTRKVKATAVKSRLHQLSELIKDAETQRDEEKVKLHQEQFDKLSKLLSTPN